MMGAGFSRKRWSEDAGERARLLQSPSVESGPKVIVKNSRGGTSAFRSVFIMVNAALGAGLLNFPAAFNTAGGVAAEITVQMCLLVFIISGLVVLAYFSQVSNEGTYQEVVRVTFGRVIGVLCKTTITVYTFGTCVAFLLIIGDQLDKLIAAMVYEPKAAVSSHWYTDPKFTISLTSILAILPLSIPKEIGFQKYAR
nr:PREDICTED: putative sodium-coupled neutral amino acid transporter 7 [Latimeria chalumnae]|eukprot:XP_014354445.1 PREDICTED: putative sodium-coupled neutral amino acid transporter 7 [Latimeria chalumnae]